jgi:hypothetical protein
VLCDDLLDLLAVRLLHAVAREEAVMPRPIRAGVLGMARTMRSLPSQLRDAVGCGMPAATLRCSAAGVNGPAPARPRPGRSGA